MAGDWIKMRVDLREDPTVFKIAEAIGDDDLTIIGRLFCFWSWADKHAVDGRVDGAATKLINRIVSKDGFAEALIEAGWLMVDAGGATIPNFDRHNGESAKERSLKNARQAKWRQKKDVDVSASPSTQASTSPSTDAPTREEKRREDKKKSKKEKTTIPDDFKISERVIEWAKEKNHTRLPDHFDHFVGSAKSKGYEYVDWDDAFMNAIRTNWARLPETQAQKPRGLVL